jgi:hypothetical protein
MAITASGLYALTLEAALNNTIALDLESETMKIALFAGNTPNFSTDTAYGVSPYDTGEVSGGSWSAGGYTLVGTELTVQAISGTSLVFDATDVSQVTTTLTDSEGGLIYADALAGNNAVAMIYWGAGDFSTSNGTFAVTWTAPGSGGIFSIDCTP